MYHGNTARRLESRGGKRLRHPHISRAAKESRQRLMDMAAANAKAFLDGAPINVVNAQAG